MIDDEGYLASSAASRNLLVIRLVFLNGPIVVQEGVFMARTDKKMARKRRRIRNKRLRHMKPMKKAWKIA